MLRRRGGLVRTVGRTAVIAGTATAVSGRVARRQESKYEQNAAPPPEDYAPEPAAAPAPAGDDLTSQLEQLSQLHNAGVLSDEEFASAKAKLLS
jgi:putative oligomerization/nucleic acid binding protein